MENIKAGIILSLQQHLKTQLEKMEKENQTSVPDSESGSNMIRMEMG